MTDFKPSYQSDNIAIFEWPQPICEIKNLKDGSYLVIKEREDAKAIRDSLNTFLFIHSPEATTVEAIEAAKCNPWAGKVVQQPDGLEEASGIDELILTELRKIPELVMGKEGSNRLPPGIIAEQVIYETLKVIENHCSLSYEDTGYIDQTDGTKVKCFYEDYVEDLSTKYWEAVSS